MDGTVWHTDRMLHPKTVKWGKSVGFSDFSFEFISQAQAAEVLSAYMQEVAEGVDTKQTSQPHIKMVQDYLQAAASLSLDAGRDDTRFLLRYIDFAGKLKYVPLLAHIFSNSKNRHHRNIRIVNPLVSR